MTSLGIRREDRVVVYDSVELGLFSAPRVAWMLRVFAHKGDVHVLDNFKEWVRGGLPVESGDGGGGGAGTGTTTTSDTADVAGEVRGQAGSGQGGEEGDYIVTEAEVQRSLAVGFDEMRAVITAQQSGSHGGNSKHKVQILDARSYGRWSGAESEPRPGLSSGHMPGSISVPVSELLDPETKTLLDAETLRRVFRDKGVDPARPVISSCGTGVTAAVVDVALAQAGYADTRIYDGSWTEWAQRVSAADGLIVKSE